ncbi:MAG: NAD(P)H-dependent oxidoreductase [Pseudomonadota bacterium]
MNILHIDSSARHQGSITRDLGASIVKKLSTDSTTVTYRDISAGLPVLSEDWVNANFTPADARNDTQKALLAQSDGLVDELKAADTLVLGLPIYNFGVPAALKTWVDLVARVGMTFRYSEAGPQGLLAEKRAIVAVASGGTQAGSEIDFATTYIKHFLGFLGIHDVTFVAADQMAIEPEETLAAAKRAIETLAA